MTKRTFWDRLQEAMAESGKKTNNLTAAASLIGAHYTAATKWRDGGLPSMENAVQLGVELGVSVEWLLTGRGSKRPVNPVPEDAWEPLRYWAMLGPEDREAALRYLRVMSKVPFKGDPKRREEYHAFLEGEARRRDAETKGET